MKLLTIKRNRGTLLLGLLVIILAIVIIGIVAYAIFKALSRWKPRKIEPDDVAQWVQNCTAEMQTNLPASGELSDGTFIVRLSDTNYPLVNVQRSTNLVDWETIARITQPEIVLFRDTNPPWPAAFYRVRE